MSPTPPPVQTDPDDAPTRLVVRPDEHDRDPLGALLNPDTRLRYASAGPRDLADLSAVCE